MGGRIFQSFGKFKGMAVSQKRLLVNKSNDECGEAAKLSPGSTNACHYINPVLFSYEHERETGSLRDINEGNRT
jgi:hypothetical protein